MRLTSLAYLKTLSSSGSYGIDKFKTDKSWDHTNDLRGKRELGSREDSLETED